MTPTQHGNIAAAYIMRMTDADLDAINDWIRIWANQCLNGTLSGSHEAAQKTREAIANACARMSDHDLRLIELTIGENTK